MATADVKREAPTEAQRQAIESRDPRTFLSAGAGCGKTFALTNRFLANLEPTSDDGDDSTLPLARLVAITFTDRAAREMRERIRREIRRRLLDAPTDSVSDYWLRILRRLETAQISTIHSFCTSILREHAVEAGLDPKFAVMQAGEVDTLLAELIDDRLRTLLAERNDDLIRLTVDFDLGGVRGILSRLLGERYRLKFAAWRAESPEALTERWAAYHRDKIVPDLARRLKSLPELKAIVRLFAESPPPHAKFKEKCTTLVEAATSRTIKPSQLTATLDELHETAKLTGAPRNAWEGAEDLKERYGKAFEKFRKAVGELRDMATFDPAAARPSAETTLAFMRLAEPIAKAYDDAKREPPRLDFDDLLTKARDLLKGNPEVRQSLAGRIDLLMLDECQDTDPVQAELVELLMANEDERPLLFTVGDFKQSIYRFRRADPELFRKFRDDATSKRSISLRKNFRSQQAILDFVNALFCDYFGDEYEPLDAKYPTISPPPIVEFLWAMPEMQPDEEQKLGAEQLRTIEADWIARRIRNLVESHESRIPVKGKPAELRPVTYGDIAILFRALSDAALYETALQQQGVPYYVVGGKAFYSRQEVFDLLNFLRVLDSQLDEVALAGVLRSPFFSLRDDTLFLLAQHAGGLSGGLFASSLTDDLIGDERRRAEFAAATLRELRAVKNRRSITELINEILSRTAYDAILTSEFLGERKLANLRKLLDMARTFDKTGVQTLTDFIAWLAESVASQPDEAPAAVEAEKSAVVRLMSIHQAKGLEFPVVVVPDLERKPRSGGERAAFDPQLGPLVSAAENKATDGMRLFRFVESDLDEQESVRLFYVAVTRAADYLILSSGVKDLESASTGWRAFLGERFDLAKGTFAGSNRYEGAQVEILVTTTRPEVEKPPPAPQHPDWAKLVAAADGAAPNRDAAAEAELQPIEARADSRRRYSFSRLTGRIVVPREEGDDVEPGQPATTDVADGTAMGILVHGVLATLDFRHPAIDRSVRRLAARHGGFDEPTIVEATAMIERFVASPRGRALAKAKHVQRELEFLMAWPPGAAPTADSPYLQGFIDCLYEDDAGRLHLLDYKTHQVAAAEVAKVATTYEMQLWIYSLAVERIWQRTPDELTLSFLRSGAEHRVIWDDAARRRVAESIDAQLKPRP